MRRAMTWTTALMVVLAGFAVMSENQASAGLFNRNRCKPARTKIFNRNKCCKPVACCPAPCETAVAEAPANPCGCQTVASSGCETKCQTCGTRRQIFVREEVIDIGQLISPQSRLASLVGSDAFWVQVSLPYADLRRIAIPDVNATEGSRVLIRQDLGGETIERQGRVIRLQYDLEPMGRMARVLSSK